MFCHYKLRVTKHDGQTDVVKYVHKHTLTCPCRLPLKVRKIFVFHISQPQIYNRPLNISRAVVSRFLEATFDSFCPKDKFLQNGFPFASRQLRLYEFSQSHSFFISVTAMQTIFEVFKTKEICIYALTL